MNEPKRSPVTLLLTGLLAANLGLLWVQGAQLNRQHQALTQIHTDIQDLADSIDAYTNGDGGDQGDGGAYQDGEGNLWAPARHRHHARASHHWVRASFQDPDAAPAQSSSSAPAQKPDAMDQGRKDQQDANRSALDAVAKARDTQSKLSIEENYRKGQEERKIQEAQYAWTRWVWLGLGALVVVFLIRAWIIKRGQ